MTQLLRHVPDGFRGRVFSTIESIQWRVMMISMQLAGDRFRQAGIRGPLARAAGMLSSHDAIFWGWRHWTGRLPSRSGRASNPRRWKSMESPRSDALTGKVVLVTGAAKRIGRGIALDSPAREPRVAIHYISSEEEARQTAAECGGADLFRANLEKVPEIERMFGEVAHHSAASTAWSTTPLASPASIRSRSPRRIGTSSTSVNLKAVFFCCQHGALMKARAAAASSTSVRWAAYARGRSTRTIALRKPASSC